MNKHKRDPILETATQKSDEFAASYWRLAASNRGQAYKKWLNILKNATDACKNEKEGV